MYSHFISIQKKTFVCLFVPGFYLVSGFPSIYQLNPVLGFSFSVYGTVAIDRTMPVTIRFLWSIMKCVLGLVLHFVNGVCLIGY